MERSARYKSLAEKSQEYKTLAEKAQEEVKTLSEKVDHYTSSAYTEEVINVFQTSEDYQNELFGKTFAFYDRGAAHVLCQFHHLIPDKRLMCEVFEGSFADKRFRGGSDFIPYSKEEL